MRTNASRMCGLVGLGLVSGVVALGGCVVVVGNHSTRYDEEWYERYEGRPSRTIGVVIEPVGKALGAQLGVDPDKCTLITEVVSGRPAERAGVQKYDVVTQIDGVDSAPPGRLREVIRSKGAGESVKLRVLRNGQPLEIMVTLDKGESGG